jgi:hypothetical protein
MNISDHFLKSTPAVRATYDAILRVSRKFGEVEEDPKKTSIHLVRRSAFAGIATRKEKLILTLKAPADIASARVAKREQVSAHRWHVEVPLSAPAEVDRDVVGWLRQAWEMS